MSFAGTPPHSKGDRPRGPSALGDAMRGVSAFASRLSGGAARPGRPPVESGREAAARARADAPMRRGMRDREAYAADLDWAKLGAFGAGIALGALLGASTALLYAPQSGRATRAVIRKRARRLTNGAGDVWDDLGDELRSAARRGRRGLRRGVTRGRWRAADAIDA